MKVSGYSKLLAIGVGLLYVSGIQKAEAQTFHCPADTAKAMELTRKYYQPGKDPAPLCGDIAAELVGAVYVPIAKEDSLGEAPIRLDGFDELAFVNTVGAIAKLATSPGHARPKDLGLVIDNLTFRRGEKSGFPMRMNYAADWILDNKSRGNVEEFTEDYSNVFKTKSLDYVTRNKDKYAALKDSATYEKLRMVELGYRTFKIPYMKRESTEWKDIKPLLRDGDIIVLLTNEQDKDIFDIGFIKKRDDGFHYIHASEKEGKVVEESEPLGRYIKRNSKYIFGWRWVRLK